MFKTIEFCHDCPCYDIDERNCKRGGGNLPPDSFSCDWAYTARCEDDLAYTEADVREWEEFNNA